MSVFAFMGEGGLLKKDNELTLSIIEETLAALFNAIMRTDGNDAKVGFVSFGCA